MTESNNANSYEQYQQQMQAIQLANQPILDNFENWLKQSALSEKTVKDHVDNIRFFAQYLALYEFSPCRLDEATSGNIYFFLAEWFPRKALWSFVNSTKAYLASFKKFFKGCWRARCLLKWQMENSGLGRCR